MSPSVLISSDFINHYAIPNLLFQYYSITCVSSVSSIRGGGISSTAISVDSVSNVISLYGVATYISCGILFIRRQKN